MDTAAQCKAHAEEILTRCRDNRKMYSDIYKTLGKEFEYREPTADEYLEAIEIKFKVYKERKALLKGLKRQKGTK